MHGWRWAAGMKHWFVVLCDKDSLGHPLLPCEAAVTRTLSVFYFAADSICEFCVIFSQAVANGAINFISASNLSCTLNYLLHGAVQLESLARIPSARLLALCAHVSHEQLMSLFIAKLHRWSLFTRFQNYNINFRVTWWRNCTQCFIQQQQQQQQYMIHILCPEWQ